MPVLATLCHSLEDGPTVLGCPENRPFAELRPRPCYWLVHACGPTPDLRVHVKWAKRWWDRLREWYKEWWMGTRGGYLRDLNRASQRKPLSDLSARPRPSYELCQNRHSTGNCASACTSCVSCVRLQRFGQTLAGVLRRMHVLVGRAQFFLWSFVYILLLWCCCKHVYRGSASSCRKSHNFHSACRLWTRQTLKPIKEGTFCAHSWSLLISTPRPGMIDLPVNEKAMHLDSVCINTVWTHQTPCFVFST